MICHSFVSEKGKCVNNWPVGELFFRSLLVKCTVTSALNVVSEDWRSVVGNWQVGQSTFPLFRRQEYQVFRTYSSLWPVGYVLLQFSVAVLRSNSTIAGVSVVI